MGNWRDTSLAEQRRIAKAWLATLSETLERRKYERVTGMMHADGYWRDLLTFSWDFRTLHGAHEVESWLREAFDLNAARNFRLEGEPSIDTLGEHRETLEFFFTFETDIAHGRGFARLVGSRSSPETAKAITILTTMKELKAFPEALGRNRPREDMRVSSRGLENWLDRRNEAREFRHKDPDVIIIGAGQSGLMMAARLAQLNISTLLVEKSERIGDVWRKRYHSLKLHNEICMNHFPYMPFPDTWPVYLPKDKLADWFEFYAESMELNVWTKTSFLGGEYDHSDKRWTVRLRRADGSIRTMRPRHVIMAMGVSGIPSIPELKGMSDFKGKVLHSSGDSDDLEVKGKSVLVVGAGTSAHDIAQNLHLRGADVTMLQRSSVTVVSLEPSSVRAYEMYRRNEGIRPIVDIDMMTGSVPYDLLARLHRPLSRQMAEEDEGLLAGLRKVGFLLDNGEDDTGYFLKLLRSQSGYYLNVGASDLIIEGKIKLKTAVEIERLVEKKVIFSDGSALDLDILVLATGYEPLQETVRAMFGDEMADQVGAIWGIGADGELRNMYARTVQEGFFVVGGGFPAARAYSHYTALLIKADLEGFLPPRPSAPRKSRIKEGDAKPEQLERPIVCLLTRPDRPAHKNKGSCLRARKPQGVYLMRDRLELPRMSIAERDRRWSGMREQMRARGIDCLVLWGWPAMWDFATANARYLCPIGGNAENNTLIFPLEGEPTSFVFMPTFVEYWKRAQDWVGDVRSRRGTWAETVVARLKEMGLERANIGMDGLAGPLDPDGWLPHSIYESLKSALPNVRFINLGDLMEMTRSVKSAEEIALLEKAAALGDKMLQACSNRARPGVRESDVYAHMMEAMLADGGEEPTLFLWACDRYPFPHPFRLPTTRPMEKRDLITCEIHPKIGGYFSHVERTFCLGEPDNETQRIHDGCVAAFRQGMQVFGPGKSIVSCMNEVKRVIDDAGLGICETGIHGHGLASLEYPRYRFHALKADQAALTTIGGEFKAGMVFAFNIDLFDPKWRNGETGAVFADTVVITETGARCLHSFSQELQRVG